MRGGNGRGKGEEDEKKGEEEKNGRQRADCTKQRETKIKGRLKGREH